MAPGSKSKLNGKPRVQRRPSNRDEFDGPHQFLKRPPPEYIAMQERELPRLPTHLLVQEQDSVLNQVNDRLSQCAFDFVAKYQFPIPLSQDMRPVERPQDREWTEWVYLLKRLATKRRIPARVLYNGQIRQFVTILENSLEMRHAARHQSRPLKDDRNILQLISAGIQVAKILKDAQAMVRSGAPSFRLQPPLGYRRRLPRQPLPSANTPPPPFPASNRRYVKLTLHIRTTWTDSTFPRNTASRSGPLRLLPPLPARQGSVRWEKPVFLGPYPRLGWDKPTT